MVSHFTFRVQHLPAHAVEYLQKRLTRRSFWESMLLHQLGGSWVVISGAISRVTVRITHIKGLIAVLITAHEPPGTPNSLSRQGP